MSEMENYIQDEIDDNGFVDISSSELKHYGTPRHSGRYPWGSGKNPQRSKDWLSKVEGLRKSGMSEKDVAKAMDLSVEQLRAKKTLALAAKKNDEYYKWNKLREKGWSNAAIARQFGVPASTVSDRLKEGSMEKVKTLTATSDILKDYLVKNPDKFVDVSAGSEHFLNVSQTRLKASLNVLKEQNYEVKEIKIDQMGTRHKTTMLVLCPPGTNTVDIYNNLDKIQATSDIGEYVIQKKDGCERRSIEYPKSISSDRVGIRYAEEGGADRDGLIEIRPGIKELDMGNSRYAQVRIAVDDSHYIKGMAVYNDNLPEGVDVLVNSNKKAGTPKMDTLKPLNKEDPEHIFSTPRSSGAVIDRQNWYVDDDGVEKQGLLNIVREEGAWSKWSNDIASQMLSKQSVPLAKQQLNLDFAKRKDEYDEIMSLNNSELKRKLLDEFAGECDGAAEHLQAAGFNRQEWKVLLPFPEIKQNEVYAPNFKDGEEVVLIRFPHGGTFEIPSLRVNNSYKNAQKVIGDSPDAIGIHSAVAEKLSGADFDGDAVLIIPNNDKRIQYQDTLSALKNFNTKSYKNLPGMPEVGSKENPFNEGREMGMVSNLITDMTLQNASKDELARAVKHSMVVIDAKKHNLNWQQSFIDNDIQQLKDIYQYKGEGKKGGGASTLISRASSEEQIKEQKVVWSKKDPVTGEYLVKQGINVKTGELVTEDTGRTYVDYKNGGKIKEAMEPTTKMRNVKDARELMSGPDHKGTLMEQTYAKYANDCKALANEARKSFINIGTYEKDTQAAKTYAPEVESLNNKLKTALMNAPLERKAQLKANVYIKGLKKDNDLTYSELQKEKGKAIERARREVGAGKQKITITDREWDAIQAKAISASTLRKILMNADTDELKQRAMPKNRSISDAKVSRIKAYAASGRTTAEIADALGLSPSTIRAVLAD